MPLTFFLFVEPDKVVRFHDLEVLDDAGIQRLGLFAELLLHAVSKVCNGLLAVDQRPEITAGLVQMHLCGARFMEHFLRDRVEHTGVLHLKGDKAGGFVCVPAQGLRTLRD